MGTESWLVVGLGNPGPGYAGNRHNIGQMVLDDLARRTGDRFKSHKTRSVVAESRPVPGGPRMVLAKPLSYMNESGSSVAQLMAFYGLESDRLIVVHDELDIPFDTIKLKSGGGHGGHNGLRSIVSAVGSADFLRVRVGIGRPPGRQDAADFVLRDFGPAERGRLPVLLGDAADAVEAIVTDGLTAAQLRFHTAKD